MVDPKFVQAINAVAELYQRPALSEQAASLYFRAVDLPLEQVMQALVDWVRREPFNFPDAASLRARLTRLNEPRLGSITVTASEATRAA